MRNPLLAAAAACVLAMGATPDARAVDITKTATRSPAGACMLSIPTTNTGVRPKATGFRNEGTVANFVICNFDIVSDDEFEGFLSLTLYLASIDGAAHDVSCTAMNRYANWLTGDYSTKIAHVPAGSSGAVVDFVPSDFPSTQLIGWNASITCNLPPGTSIYGVSSSYNDDVGN
jgi:hypothetical protein